MSESDKIFWHQYINEYERLVLWPLDGLARTLEILEFGVLDGQSIGYWLGRFGSANIYGVDIFDKFDKISDKRFTYIRQDQGKRSEVREMFKKLDKKFDLIIDDGSHDPMHQANCLIESFPWIRSKGVYIVEDIHTSYRRVGTPTVFHVLMMIKHLKATGIRLTKEMQHELDCYFTEKEISDLYFSISDLHLIRRSHLPLHCWRCGKSDYDYSHLKCRCGEDLYKEADSMSFVIWKK